MTTLDWIIVLLLNGSIIIYALIFARDTKTSSDWFLAGRTLPWWIVGLSLYATLIDSSDMIVDSGGAYQFGVRMFVFNWVGVIAGWLLMVYLIALPMYRLGMYTNAEYLEARFGPFARMISVLIQVQFRTMVMGIMVKSIFLTLSIVFGLTAMMAWIVVVLIALIAVIYTMSGGLKAVAITDALQSIIMVIGSIIIFCIVFDKVEGWSGLKEKLEKNDATISRQMLHIGEDRIETIDASLISEKELDRHKILGTQYEQNKKVLLKKTSGWIVCMNLIFAGMAYSIVNHTQSMRLLGAKSEWDLKMSIVLASGILIIVTFLNLFMGVMGRALYPDISMLNVPEALQTVDSIFPVLVRDLTFSGLRGVIIAGIFAASFSTFDSIGSTLSALITRDIYARLIVTDADDSHYLFVGRWLTPLIIFGSFLYLPFLSGGMFQYYLRMVGVFVIPLLTVYLMGALTRVHRKSGTIGLLTGVVFGLWALIAETLYLSNGTLILPASLINSLNAAPVSMFVTAASMVIVSFFYGFSAEKLLLHEEKTKWLQSSREQVSNIQKVESVSSRNDLLPIISGILILVIGLVLSFVVFW
jgi:solute:Na+ symporter, SSS family